MKSRLDLQKYINMKFVGDNTKNVKVFLREHNDTKVVSLAVLCLLNDDIRKNVFNKNNVEMTIVMFRIAKNGQMSYVTLLAFGEGKIRNESEEEESEDGINGENKNIIATKVEKNFFTFSKDFFFFNKQKILSIQLLPIIFYRQDKQCFVFSRYSVSVAQL